MRFESCAYIKLPVFSNSSKDFLAIIVSFSILVNILDNYLYMPMVKLERFAASEIIILFFKKSEIIYNEGEENRYIYLINEGEANLLQNMFFTHNLLCFKIHRKGF